MAHLCLWQILTQILTCSVVGGGSPGYNIAEQDKGRLPPSCSLQVLWTKGAPQSEHKQERLTLRTSYAACAQESR